MATQTGGDFTKETAQALGRSGELVFFWEEEIVRRGDM